MFTGIVTAIGTITNVEDRGDTRVVVACPWDPAGIDIGASIACSGVCLTVVDRGGAAGDAAAHGGVCNLEREYDIIHQGEFCGVSSPSVHYLVAGANEQIACECKDESERGGDGDAERERRFGDAREA